MKTKQHPATAFAVTTPATIDVGDNGDGAKTAPIRLVARTSEPINHPYWGRIVHDLTGFTIPGGRNRIALDYAHRDDEIIGYANRFNTDNNDLELSGALTPFRDGDRASEVIFKASSGVPYQASINFAGGNTVLQEVDEGDSTQVNGYKFEGPGVVVRQWELRSCAVCPAGADSGTSAELVNDQSQFSVSILEASDMALHEQFTTAPAVEDEVTHDEPVQDDAVQAESADADEEKQPEVVEAEAVDTATDDPSAEAVTPDEESDAAAVEAPAEATALSAAEGQRMVETFGPRGAVAFVNGKSFDETLRELYGEQQAENAQLRQEIEKLKAQLAAEADDAPATFSAVDKDDSTRGGLPIRIAK